MFAKTRHANWLNRLTLLYVSIVTLIHQRKRSAPQIEKLLGAPQTFKDEPNKSTIGEGYVAVRVCRTHGGALGNIMILINISKLNIEHRYSLEPDAHVSFESPSGGWSYGRMLFVLTKEQAASITEVLASVPEEE